MAGTIQNSSFVLKILIISIVAITLLYATQFVMDADQFRYISTPSYTIIPGALAVTSSFVAIKEWKRHSPNKNAILLFAIGMVCWFVAEQTWQVIDLVLNEEPFPSYADIFYLIAYPFFIGFLIFYLRPVKKSITIPVILFSIIISLVFLIPSLPVWLEYYQEEPSQTLFVGLLYPVLSSGLLFFALLGIVFFFRGSQTYFWVFIFIGFLIDTISDTLFLFTIIDDSYYDGQITDLLYLIGYLFYTAGIVYYFKTKDSFTVSKTPSVTFDTITKFAIPLIIGTVFAITSISLLYYYSYEQEFTKDSLFTSLFIGISIIIAIYSITIIIINKNIEKFVELKTSDLENQKQDLEILLEKKSDEIAQSSEFSNLGINLSQIIHDIRNPITILKVNLDIIANSEINNPLLTKRITSMQESVKMIDEQINDILSYIKKPTLELVESSLLKILKQSIQNTVIPKSVTINLPPQDLKLYCDPVRLSLVFINILNNAVDAMEKSGIVSINAKHNRNKITISIENSGPSIPVDDLDNLFEPLFTTKSNGTGLGLATCKKIIQQHNGMITAKNNPTTFVIELPVF